MIVTDELKDTVRATESELMTKKRDAAKAESESLQKQGEADRLWSTMNFRERRLAGWFGGNKETVARHKELRALTAQFNQSAADIKAQSEELDAKVVDTIDGFLRQNDPQYSVLLAPRDAAAGVLKDVNSFIRTVDRALDEINEAETMETMDMFSKNKGISMLSYMENSEAKDAVKKVKAAVAPFQRAVNAYSQSLKDFEIQKPDLNVGNTMDLAFDFAFDSFDFMSIFTLSALGKAEDQMREVHRTAGKVDKIITTNFEKAEKAVQSYLQDVRLACA